jgi:hypothetical protein
MSQPSDDEADDDNEEEANAEEPKLRHPNIDDECFSYTLCHHPEFPPLKHLTFYHFLMNCVTSGYECSEDTPLFNLTLNATRMPKKALKVAINRGFHAIHPKVVYNQVHPYHNNNPDLVIPSLPPTSPSPTIQGENYALLLSYLSIIREVERRKNRYGIHCDEYLDPNDHYLREDVAPPPPRDAESKRQLSYKMAHASGSSGDPDDDPPDNGDDEDDEEEDQDGEEEDDLKKLIAIHKRNVKSLDNSAYIVDFCLEALQEMMVGVSDQHYIVSTKSRTLAALAHDYNELEKVSINIYLSYSKPNLTTFINPFQYALEWQR